MKSVGSYEAKTHLPRLLSQVEKGETITITKRGKPVAVLSPAQQWPSSDVKAVIAEFRAYSKEQARSTRLSYGPRNQGNDRGGTALSKKKGVAKPPKEGLVIDSSVAIAWCFPDEQDDLFPVRARCPWLPSGLLCPIFGILKSRTRCSSENAANAQPRPIQ